MNIKDFKNKKVTIMGLGLHGGGLGAAKFFSQNGAKVLVTDLKDKEKLKESLEKLKNLPVKFILGQHRSEDFINTDLVIKNPAVADTSKYLEIAKENKVPIDTDIGIFFKLCPAQIIGVTGTKGKSTTASLISKMLARKYSDVVLAGNIRTSVLEKLAKIKNNSLVVLELSSWQLAGLKTHKKSPRLSVITNIMPDHLNTYKTLTDYIDDKKIIFQFQKPKDYLILNYDHQIVRELDKEAKSQVFYFSAGAGNELTEKKRGAFIRDQNIFFGSEEDPVCPLLKIALLGQHNLSNILAAATAAKLYNVSNKSIKKIIEKFKGLEGRIELIEEINGVRYINDTTATIPEAVIAALNSFPQKQNIILIAGGADKNLDFSQLAEIIIKKTKALILLPGAAADKIEQALKTKEKMNGALLPIIRAEQMPEAVKEASRLAQNGDIVILSPASASFGLFKHEFERGEAFNKAVALLK